MIYVWQDHRGYRTANRLEGSKHGVGRQEATAVIQVSSGGVLDQRGSSGSSEKWPVSGYILKI